MSVQQPIPENQLPKEILGAFSELSILKHLRQAGITRRMGFTCSYLFKAIFCLLFQHRNWFQVLESKKNPKGFPAKDAVYRFLNAPSFAWRRFLSVLTASVVAKVSTLTHSSRPRVMIVDDSAYERNRSKRVELLARCFDHVEHVYYKGFRMLTLGWSDGHTFIPLDFSLLSSAGKALINAISATIDKRTCGYKRRVEAMKPAPEVIVDMIARALGYGVNASHVLMDTWFMQPPLVTGICNLGLDVIGMLKRGNMKFRAKGRCVNLETLYHMAESVESANRAVLRSIIATWSDGRRMKIVFVRHRSKKNEWLAIGSTDLTLTEQEIINLYSIRWDIETFFKCCKSLLQLRKEFQGRSYDLLISHTTIVFVRYIVLSWQHRQQNDDRTLGGLFFDMCDELSDLDWTIALKQLLEILQGVAAKTNKRVAKVISFQLSHWIAGLPSYIKAYLPLSLCES